MITAQAVLPDDDGCFPDCSVGCVHRVPDYSTVIADDGSQAVEVNLGEEPISALEAAMIATLEESKLADLDPDSLNYEFRRLGKQVILGDWLLIAAWEQLDGAVGYSLLNKRRLPKHALRGLTDQLNQMVYGDENE